MNYRRKYINLNLDFISDDHILHLIFKHFHLIIKKILYQVLLRWIPKLISNNELNKT